MKRIVLFIAMFLFVAFAYSQKEIAQVKYNKYEVTEVLSNELTQIGYFKVINGKMVRDGVWKLIRDDKVVQKAYYENGKFMWIECHVKGKFTRDQLEIERLKKEIEDLKSQDVITSN